jgi:hypothetical protein
MADGTFGSGAPKPRWWDYALGLTAGGLAPSAVNDLWEQRDLARKQAAASAAMKAQLYGEAFGNDFGYSALANRGNITPDKTDPGYTVNPKTLEASQNAVNDERALAASGMTQRPAAGAAGAMAYNGGAFGGDRGIPGSSGNLLYKADGTPRSYQELQGDRRFIALQNDPEASKMLSAWSNAAKERQAKWDFHNDQYFNVNSDDPTAGSRRVGTGMDNGTGIYTEIGPNGQVIARAAEGFNPAIAAVTTAKKTAENNADVTMYGQKKGVDLAYDPRIAGATETAKKKVALDYDPRIASATTTANEKAKAPYAVETVQGVNGPVTMTRQQVLDQAGAFGPIYGLDSAGRAANTTASDEINTLQRNNNKLTNYATMIDKDQLDLGLVNNVVAKGRNFIGASDAKSRNYASFQADLQGMMNESLMLNKGTQTEGDANRAWKAILDNTNDPQLVRQRLTEIAKYNQQAIDAKNAQIANRSGSTINTRAPAVDIQGALAEQAARRKARGY